MQVSMTVFIVAFGAVVGSFLNVAILRYNTGMGFTRGRSKCFSCGKKLRWRDLLPVLSFLALHGRCGQCGSKISWQYPAVEAITALLFYAAYAKFGLRLIVLPVLSALSAFVVIAGDDLRHKNIPFGAMVWLVCSSFVFVFAFARIIELGISGKEALWWLSGCLAFAVPYALIFLLSRGRAMGFGDVELGFGLGFLLGFYGSLNAAILSFYIGAIVALLLMLAGYLFKRLNSSPFQVKMKSEIPFGPFVIAAALSVFFFGVDVLGLVLF